MTFEVIELLSDEEGQPYLGKAEINLRTSNFDLIGDQANMSVPTSCRQIVYLKFPVGFKSASRIPDREQTAVVLTGSLRISANETQAIIAKQGEVFRLPKAKISEHTLEVVGDCPVTLMVMIA